MSIRRAKTIVVSLLTLTVCAACAKTPADSNPFRDGSVYSNLPYNNDNQVQMLSTGELHYNP